MKPSAVSLTLTLACLFLVGAGCEKQTATPELDVTNSPTTAVQETTSQAKDEDYLILGTEKDHMVISGKVIDSVGGRPIPGAAITVADTSYGAKTDTDGNYTLELGGVIKVTVAAVQSEFEVSGGVPVTGAGNHEVNFTLTPTGAADRIARFPNPEDLDPTLNNPKLDMDRTVTVPEATYVAGESGITATVTDRSGEPIPFVAFVSSFGGFSAGRQMITDENGTFSVSEVPAGTHRFNLVKFDSPERDNGLQDLGGPKIDYLIHVVPDYGTHVRITVDAR